MKNTLGISNYKTAVEEPKTDATENKMVIDEEKSDKSPKNN